MTTQSDPASSRAGLSVRVHHWFTLCRRALQFGPARKKRPSNKYLKNHDIHYAMSQYALVNEKPGVGVQPHAVQTSNGATSLIDGAL
ncbi:hypothetical protein ACTXT7_013390 [Hymenolepis weldensis]